MTTHRLYYDDAYLQNFEAHVLICIPTKPVCTDSRLQVAWEVLLDRTAFYPSSGGQPNDLGRLGEAVVLDVRDDGEEIAHILDRELPRGEIAGRVDWARRLDHMQQHTGQHLLSAIFHERFGLPTVSFHLGGDICTIDLRGPEPSADVLLEAQRGANAIIFEDRRVNVRYGTPHELAEQGVRKDVEREGILRAIEIEALDLQPCGGTHVKSTGLIGLVLVRRCAKIRQDWRVEFVCGGRAERFATGDFELVRAISGRLKCGSDEALAVIDKSFAERDAHFKSLHKALQELAEARAKLLIATATPGGSGVRVVTQILSSENPDLLLPLATELAKNEQSIALLVHEATGQLVFAQSAGAGTDMRALVKQVLTAHPGKGGGTQDFVRAKLADPTKSAAALALAIELVGARA